uniref:hypothetical protein n=1 Tax=Cellvibrio fontiphilus TaxID=1815559 RepID=UPI002B4BFC47|nr:hypothetical protein [Cellvibrio fontiphilus]
MEFSKNFKSFWWTILIFSIGLYLYGRHEKLLAGDPTWFDAIVFIVWVALAIGPFFKEMKLFGFEFKQEVEKLKEHVSGELQAIRNTIQNTSENKQTMNPQFLFGYPPPADSQLLNIQEQIKSTIHSAISSFGLHSPKSDAHILEEPAGDIDLLFRARLGIEKELRKIYGFISEGNSRRPEPIFRIVESLNRAELLTRELGHAIREVYSVCSPAIHGEEITKAQVEFVKNTAPELISALKSISNRYA